MIALLLLAWQAAPAPPAPPAGPDSPAAYAAFLLRPEAVGQWQEEAPALCAQASAPAECRPAYLSARYSQAAMAVCRYGAGLGFRDVHGTTTTSYAQDAIRRTCRASIDNCRRAWLNYDRVNFAGRPGAADPRRRRHFGLFLDETCGAEAGVRAPF